MRLCLLGASLLVIACVVPVEPEQKSPTWAKDVAPLIHERCSVCHTREGHAPFPLEQYRDVQRRWELVRQELLSRKMPPSKFTSDYGDLAIAKPLSDEQILMFQLWLRAGMPEGADAPSPPRQESGFRLGEPDLVVRTPAAPDVPSEGNPVWRAVVFDPGHTQTLRINGFDIVPQSRKSVRHVLLAVAAEGAESGATNGTLDERAARFIGAWAPGYPAWSLPKGVCLSLKPGEKLVAQILFQTTGKQEPSALDIGFYLAPTTAKEARWVAREKKDFAIRAFEEVSLTTTLEIEKPSDLLAVIPEARFFAYVVEISAEPPEGDPKTLLRSVQWDPYWTGSFVFKSAVRLEPGTKLVSTTVYENEPHSPINEGRRPRHVYSGPGLDQEVCRTHYLIVDR